MPDNPKVSIAEFAQRIKSKYPQYKDVNDTLLTQKMVAHYPQYKGMVEMGETPQPAPQQTAPHDEAKSYPSAAWQQPPVQNNVQNPVQQPPANGKVSTDDKALAAMFPAQKAVTDNAHVVENRALQNDAAILKFDKGVKDAAMTVATARLKAQGKTATPKAVDGELNNVKADLKSGKLSASRAEDGTVSLGTSAGFWDGVTQSVANSLHNLKYAPALLQAHISGDNKGLADIAEAMATEKAYISNHPYKSLGTLFNASPAASSDLTANANTATPDEGEKGLSYNSSMGSLGQTVGGGVANLAPMLIPGAGEAEAGSLLQQVAANTPRMVTAAAQTYATTVPDRFLANYQENKANGLSPEQAANKAAKDAEIQGILPAIAGGAFFSGAFGGGSAAKGLGEAIGHAVKTGAKFSTLMGAQAGADDFVKQLQGYKANYGEDISQAMKGGFFQTIAGELLPHAASLPSYAKSQLYNYINSHMERPAVEAQLKDAPQGTTEQVMSDLQAFDKAKNSIPDTVPLQEETKAAIAGKIIQRDHLNKQIADLNKHGDAFAGKVEELKKQVANIETDINQMATTNKPFDYERDNLTGAPLSEKKGYEALSDKEKEGIVVPKEYGTAEVIETGKDDNKGYRPYASINRQEGGIVFKDRITAPSEKFADKAEAQAAADKALAQHYYENGMYDNLKPIAIPEAPKTKGEPEQISQPVELSPELPKPEQPLAAVSEQEYNHFIDKNIVSDERLKDIAGKIKKQQPLDERETAIFHGKTKEINQIIADEKAPAIEQTNAASPQPVPAEEGQPAEAGVDTQSKGTEKKGITVIRPEQNKPLQTKTIGAENSEPTNNGTTGTPQSPLHPATTLPEGQVPQSGVQSNTETTGRGDAVAPPPVLKDGDNAETGGKEFTKIDQKSLQQDYGFVKKFDSKSDQSVANATMQRLQERADSNSIPIEQQAANEVAAMSSKTGEASEHDIVTAAYHLMNLDERIANAKDELTEGLLLQQREAALTTLRQLGNNAGRNLRLFSVAFKKAAEGTIETTRRQWRRDLGVEELPKTTAELDKNTTLTAADKKKARPYVQTIEGLEKDLRDIKKKGEATIKDIEDKELQAAIKKAYEQGKKEAQATTGGKGKKNSDKLRAFATKIRNSDTLDKLGLGKSVAGDAQANGFSFNAKEALAKALELMADGLDKAEAIAKAIKASGGKASKEFNDLVDTALAKLSLRDKDEVVSAIKALAQQDKATTITPDMVQHNLIHDFVKQHLFSDTPYDTVIKEATKELQEYLPDVDEKTVADAFVKRGAFKEPTKRQVQTELKAKEADVKRLALNEMKLRALEAANAIHEINNHPTLSAAEKKKAGEARKSDYEKEVDAKIKAIEDKKAAIAQQGKQAKSDYQKLETERNRQLAKVQELKDKIDSLQQNGLPEAQKKNAPPADTPEIEALKKEKAELEQSIRQDLAHQKRMEGLQQRLDAVRKRTRPAKEATTPSQQTVHPEEQKLLDAIEAEHQKWAAEKKSARRAVVDYQKMETERNRQLQKVADLKEKIANYQKGIRPETTKAAPEPDVPEIEALKKQAKEAEKQLSALEAEQRKQLRKSLSTQDAIYSLEQEAARVKNEKTIFARAIKNVDKAGEALKAARKAMEQAYSEAGIRPERQNNNEIQIYKAAEEEINKIQHNPDLSDEVKAEHIAQIKTDRDTQLHLTKQGVLINLRTSIDDKTADLATRIQAAKDDGDTATAQQLGDLHKDLQDLSTRLKPNGENLKDQVDKAEQDLNALVKSSKGTPIAGELEDIHKAFVADWQKSYEELQRQLLMKQQQSKLRSIQRRFAGGSYSQIESTPFDIQRDKVLAEQDAQIKKAYTKLNAMSEMARKDSRSFGDKALDVRKQWLVATFSAIEKVAGSAVTKPLIDAGNKQTFGRLSGAITGIKPTELGLVKDTFRQMKNSESAAKFMTGRNNAYVDALVNYEKAKGTPQEAQALQAMQAAELKHAASLAYLYLNAGSHIDIKQIIVNAATDLDASLAKYNKQYPSEIGKGEKYGNWKKVGYWLESVNRTHGAMKSVSARQALMDGYIENLQYFQKQGEPLDVDTRMKAWDMATLMEYEQGRFSEPTKLSNSVAKLKSHENKWLRYPANFLVPVSKISINIAKQGIDRAMPLEVMYRTLGKDALAGMKLNAEEGIEFKNFASKYYNGIKKGFNELPLQQKKYINTLMARGMAGLTQYALVGFMLSSGAIKYGGAYNDNDPFKKKYGQVIGADGLPLKNGQWEFGGHRAPKLLNAIINHSPYSMPASLAADTHWQVVRPDGKGNGAKVIGQVLNETYQRLPFATAVDLFKGTVFGDEYKLERTVANVAPSARGAAELLDKDPQTGEARKVDTKGDNFFDIVWKMVKANTPGLRNTLDTKATGSSSGGSSTSRATRPSVSRPTRSTRR